MSESSENAQAPPPVVEEEPKIDVRPLLPLEEGLKPVISSVLSIAKIERRIQDGGFSYVGVTGYKVTDVDIGFQFMIVPESKMRTFGWTFTPFVCTPGEPIEIHLSPLGEPQMDATLTVRILAVNLVSIPSTFM